MLIMQGTKDEYLPCLVRRWNLAPELPNSNNHFLEDGMIVSPVAVSHTSLSSRVNSSVLYGPLVNVPQGEQSKLRLYVVTDSKVPVRHLGRCSTYTTWPRCVGHAKVYLTETDNAICVPAYYF